MNLSNKKVLLVLHQGALGGAERQALGLSNYLTEQLSCTVDLLFTYSDETTKEFDSYLKECSINKIFHFGKPYLFFKREFSYKNLKRLFWSIKYLLRLRNGLKSEKHDVIIPFLNFPSKVSYFLYKLIPSVKFTFWHQLGFDSINQDIFEYIAVYNIPCVIGNASNCLEMFKTPYKLDDKKLNILPQYISLKKENRDKNKIKKQLNICDDTIVIGMIAHYRPEKYHELLLNSFIKLAKNYDNIHLVFLGNRNNSTITEEKYIDLLFNIEKNNLKTKVSLLSDVSVHDVLNILDIGVLMSQIEGTPNVVMEYMLYSLPAITTNHPGCIGLLNDSEFLIENDEEVLTSKLNKLINSKTVREFEGSCNLERIKSYDVASYVQKLEEILNRNKKRTLFIENKI